MNHPTPPFPQRPPSGYSQHIWALLMLESDAARHRIDLMRIKTGGANGRAIDIAGYALLKEVNDYAERACRAGELLYCWHGTKATTVPDSPSAEGGAA